jgi:uncharacterized phiE125 gp8 family phage protein
MLAPVMTAPPAVAVTVDEAKAHLRIIERDGAGAVLPHEDDDLVEAFIAAATDHLDGWSGILGRALVNQTWRQDFAGFGGCMRLPLAPVAADGVQSVTYYDGTNVEQTLAPAAYHVLVDGGGPFVALTSGQAWPSTFARPDAVSVSFVAGYGNAAAVPPAIKAAILMHVGHLYENREAVNVGNIVTDLPLGHAALLAPYRRISV